MQKILFFAFFLENCQFWRHYFDFYKKKIKDYFTDVKKSEFAVFRIFRNFRIMLR